MSDIKVVSANRPNWPDHCEHLKDHPDSYVGSFNLRGPTDYGEEWYDVYVWVGNYDGRTEVCMRYGEEGSEYISPPSLKHVLDTADGRLGSHVYQATAELWRQHTEEHK